MTSYINLGRIYLNQSIKLSLIIYLVVLIFLWVTGKRRSFPLKKIIVEYIFITYLFIVLKITGIIGMHFYFDGYYQISIIPFRDTDLLMFIFNILLFAPLGFLLPIVFDNKKLKCKKTILIGLILTISIETIQIFTGRLFEIDDIIANTIGTIIGVIVINTIKKIFNRKVQAV